MVRQDRAMRARCELALSHYQGGAAIAVAPTDLGSSLAELGSKFARGLRFLWPEP